MIEVVLGYVLHWSVPPQSCLGGITGLLVPDTGSKNPGRRFPGWRFDPPSVFFDQFFADTLWNFLVEDVF